MKALEYFNLPIALFQEKYKNVTNDAKVAYAVMREKMIRGNMYDEEGNYYLTYKIEDLQKDLSLSQHKIARVNKELIEYGLLERRMMKIGEPYRLYLMKP